MSEVATSEAPMEDKLQSLRIGELEERMLRAVIGLEFKGSKQFDFARAVRVLIDAETNHEHAIESHSLGLVQVLDGRFRVSVAKLSGGRVSETNPNSAAISNYEKTEKLEISDAPDDDPIKNIDGLRKHFRDNSFMFPKNRKEDYLMQHARSILEDYDRDKTAAALKHTHDVVRLVTGVRAAVLRLIPKPEPAQPAQPVAVPASITTAVGATAPPASAESFAPTQSQTRTESRATTAPIDAADAEDSAALQIAEDEALAAAPRETVYVQKVSLDAHYTTWREAEILYFLALVAEAEKLDP